MMGWLWPASAWPMVAMASRALARARALGAHEGRLFHSSARAICRSRALPMRSVSARARYSCSIGSSAAAIGTLRYRGSVVRAPRHGDQCQRYDHTERIDHTRAAILRLGQLPDPRNPSDERDAERQEML